MMESSKICQLLIGIKRQLFCLVITEEMSWVLKQLAQRWYADLTTTVGKTQNQHLNSAVWHVIKMLDLYL